jgi:hypothetical protein
MMAISSYRQVRAVTGSIRGLSDFAPVVRAQAVSAGIWTVTLLPRHAGRLRWIDDVTLDAILYQYPMYPNSIESGFLDYNKRKQLPGPGSCPLLKRPEPFKRVPDVTTWYRMLRHLLPGTR